MAHAAVGNDFFAVQVAWGAVNELSTLRFYQQIRRRSEHPLLRAILRDVIAQGSMHYSFYRNSAIERLADRPRAQRLTSWVLRHLWSPVGRSMRPATQLVLARDAP